jgi:hypothetical protein
MTRKKQAEAQAGEQETVGPRSDPITGQAHDHRDEPDVFDQAIAARQQAESGQPSQEPGSEADIGQGNQKKPWKARMGHWRDNEAGVRIEEDRRNNLSTIIFRDKPPAKAIKLLQDSGWKEDKEAGGWSKKIDRLRPGKSRATADETVLEVDNIIREGKGLPPRQSFYISRTA